MPPSADEARESAILGRVADLVADPARLAIDLDRFGAAFATLSRVLLAAPSAEVLDRIREDELLLAWPVPEEERCRAGVELLRRSRELGEDETLVRRDHTRLFVGPERAKASPYESVHRSEEKLVFERETMVVRAAYADFDLAAPRLNREPDDHIGLELSFLGELCVRALDAIDADDRAAVTRVVTGVVSFLDQHLLVWGPTFFDQVAEAAGSEFYRGIAALGHGTLTAAGTALRP